MPATVRAELNSDIEQKFKMLSEEHIDLRDTIFAYMKQVPLVMDPRDGNINRLTRQVFELVLLFLRCGDFGEKKSDATIGTKVYLDKEKHRLETGVPSPEFTATVVNQLTVEDDVGFTATSRCPVAWDTKTGSARRCSNASYRILTGAGRSRRCSPMLQFAHAHD